MFGRRWEPLTEVWSELGRQLDEMNRVFGRLGDGTGPSSALAFPALNVWEDETKVYVETELPGPGLESLEYLRQCRQPAVVKGERKEPEGQPGTWHRRERGEGRSAACSSCRVPCRPMRSRPSISWVSC